MRHSLHPHRTPNMLSTIRWHSVEVYIELSFYGVEFLSNVSEFLEYPHKSYHHVLVITKFHIFNEVWIEKSTRIVEVACNQDSSVY